ncbi:MAG TPA: hypothetical protein PKC91_12805 [Ignavibacteria bacterium]|nr:hypothetical protein [Ignavibacteria bacterium]
MFEKFSSPLASRKIFRQRMYRSGSFAFVVFAIAISIGMSGYHYIANLNMVDSFLNAAMILGGMGLVSDLDSNAAKIFAGCYALFSGITFLSSMAIFMSPVVHRILHKLHIDIKAPED